MSPDPTPKKWRVLCVDDDPDILSILKTTLGTEHEIVGAVDGMQAVSMLDFCDADFVICDIRMPGLDGFQTVEAIRRHPAYTDVPVFFLTGETDRAMIKRGYASGGNLYLTKPFDPMRLLKNVNYFLEESGHEPRQRRMSPAAVVESALVAQGSSPHSPVTSASPKAGNPRVIVLTANASQLDRVGRGLEGKYDCVLAADPLASLQQLFRYEPDVLIINPAIPHLSGWGLVHMIASNPRLKGLTIILLEDERHPIDPRLAPAISKQPMVPSTFSAADILKAVDEAVNSPSFAVRRKTESFAALVEEEEESLGRIEKDQARHEQVAASRQLRYEKIQSFIDNQMK